MGFTVRVLFTLMLWLCFRLRLCLPFSVSLCLCVLFWVLGYGSAQIWKGQRANRRCCQCFIVATVSWLLRSSLCLLAFVTIRRLKCVSKSQRPRHTHTHIHSIDKTRKNENQKKRFPSHSSKRVKAYQTPNLVALVFFSFIFLFCFEFPILEFATWPHLLQDRDEGNPCKGLLGYAVGSCCTIILYICIEQLLTQIRTKCSSKQDAKWVASWLTDGYLIYACQTNSGPYPFSIRFCFVACLTTNEFSGWKKRRSMMVTYTN